MGSNIKINKGDWVLLIGDKPILSDSSLKKVLNESEKFDESETVITKEPATNHCYY